MEYYITRNHKGILANAIPGKDLNKNIYEVFSFAIGSFGHLVNIEEKISGCEWVKRISTTCAASPRNNKIIESIKLAMPSNY